MLLFASTAIPAWVTQMPMLETAMTPVLEILDTGSEYMTQTATLPVMPFGLVLPSNLIVPLSAEVIDAQTNLALEAIAQWHPPIAEPVTVPLSPLSLIY
jgi:hypothetical protein